jgi:hypothetical protein
VKTGHSDFQTRPLGVKTGQYPRTRSVCRAFLGGRGRSYARRGMARSEVRAMTNREVDEGALAFLNKKPPIRDDSSAA